MYYMPDKKRALKNLRVRRTVNRLVGGQYDRDCCAHDGELLNSPLILIDAARRRVTWGVLGCTYRKQCGGRMNVSCGDMEESLGGNAHDMNMPGTGPALEAGVSCYLPT